MSRRGGRDRGGIARPRREPGRGRGHPGRGRCSRCRCPLAARTGRGSRDCLVRTGLGSRRLHRPACRVRLTGPGLAGLGPAGLGLTDPRLTGPTLTAAVLAADSVARTARTRTARTRTARARCGAGRRRWGALARALSGGTSGSGGLAFEPAGTPLGRLATVAGTICAERVAGMAGRLEPRCPVTVLARPASGAR